MARQPRPRLRWLAALLFVVFGGCPPFGADSWKHYEGGGFYPARTPSMSPDESVIAYSSPRTGNGDIYLVNRDGSKTTRLTDHPAFETDPVFSPDGSSIAFAREIDHRRHIWLMDRDGSNQRQLTYGNVLDDPAAFRPDGLELNFYRSPSGMGAGRIGESFAIDPNSGKLRSLPGFNEYSPDGNQIAYYRYDESNDRDEVWIMDVDGANKRRLAFGHSPRFSPDGKTILFATQRTQPGSIWKMINVDGSKQRELGRVQDPVFVGDGKHVLCLSPEWQRQVWKLKLDGSSRERLPIPTGYIDVLRPCPSGFIVKLVTDDRVGDIYLIDKEDWSVERVTSMR